MEIFCVIFETYEVKNKVDRVTQDTWTTEYLNKSEP